MKKTAFKSEEALYINGEWLSGVDEVVNINPSNIQENLGYFAQASAEQVFTAIESAQSAYPLWCQVKLEEKQAILFAIGQELIERAQEIGTELSKEEGKTLAEGRGEVYRAGQFFQYYAAEVLRQIGDLVDSVRPDVSVEVTREPVGVVGIISPWNFPIATAAWKIAPALAFGNSIVWKPANIVPKSAVLLTEIIARQNLPKGTFNLVLGQGGSVGDALIHSGKINALSFTGSVDIGRKIATATAANFVKCQLEMGSKNALYIADDADIATAVDVAVIGSFSGTGQKCTASSRLLVDGKIHDEFVDALLAKMSTLKVAHALNPEAFMGPVVDEKQLMSNLAWVEKAKSLGAELVFGGQRLTLEHDGYYMAPTLFINTKNEWSMNQEEIFAPLSAVIKVGDLDEAIATVNSTRFGLVSGVVTQSLKTSALFKKCVETGCVTVNLPTAGTDYHVPFGGRKESSFGPREQGQYAKEFYTVVKTAYQKPY